MSDTPVRPSRCFVLILGLQIGRDQHMTPIDIGVNVVATDVYSKICFRSKTRNRFQPVVLLHGRHNMDSR